MHHRQCLGAWTMPGRASDAPLQFHCWKLLHLGEELNFQILGPCRSMGSSHGEASGCYFKCTPSPKELRGDSRVHMSWEERSTSLHRYTTLQNVLRLARCYICTKSHNYVIPRKPHDAIINRLTMSILRQVCHSYLENDYLCWFELRCSYLYKGFIIPDESGWVG